ncbi:serine hydrolase domain-containing protein [Caulobacter sp.]|uniref:serine hydrolase n=1 Tax=Caulobacter sp. TaxID=78 RepID=UPI00161E56AE
MKRLALASVLALTLSAPALAQVAPPARLNDAALSQALAGRLAELGEDYSGVVLVARRGQPFATFAQGWADRERQIPNRAETRFRIGSVNKMQTAVAVLQLVQAGKVDLDAPLITYLKAYPDAAWARKVTLHHLLSHSGRAGDIFGPAYDARREALRTPQDFIDLYGARAPDFEPGAKWDYSNYGFILLGRVVEVVSGQSYPDYMRDHVFAPAGMTGSGFEPETVDVPDRAVAYEHEEAAYTRPTLPWRGTPAGGGYATAQDLLKFAIALYDGRLLDAEHRRILTTARFDDGDGMRFGYGVAIYPGALPIVGHNGIAPGMSAELRIIADGEGVVVALSNVAPPRLAGRLARFVSDRFTAP